MESINSLAALIGIPVWTIGLVIIWTVIWKGLALWKAALLRQKWWFMALLIVNTIGLLEIFYLFYISRRYQVIVEVIEEK